MSIDLLVILGPTASGKTYLAAQICHQLNGEVVSADSRQVYSGLDIGTGKDLVEYIVNGSVIPHHLIDIKEPGYEYNVHEFQKDAFNAVYDIRQRQKLPVICGGSGLYLQALLQKYDLPDVPVNTELRNSLNSLSDHELVERLRQIKVLHNITDSVDRSRMIRALEIEHYKATKIHNQWPDYEKLVIGIDAPRSVIKERITFRLKSRLANGMIEEVQGLLENGLSEEHLIFLGLEYRYVAQYLNGTIKSYNDLFQKLNAAIHQFAKKQMTWFRKMERQGINIHWLNGLKDSELLVKEAITLIKLNKHRYRL